MTEPCAVTSRVHQLGRMNRPDLQGKLLGMLPGKDTIGRAAVTGWSNERIISKIIDLEESSAPVAQR
jgi:hypothetical protein